MKTMQYFGLRIISWEYREKIEFILFNYEIILCVLCDLKKSLNLNIGKNFWLVDDLGL